MSYDQGNRWTARATGADVGIDAGLRQYMLRIYGYMTGGLALTGAVAYWAAASGLYVQLAHSPLFFVIILAPLAMALVLGFGIQRMSLGAAQLAFWAYAALFGLSLGGIFLVYTHSSIARVFFITAATFLSMTLYGYTTRRDLTRLGSFMIMGLFGIVIAGLVNLFIGSTPLQLVISVLGVVIFTGLTAYDTQMIKENYWAGDGAAVAGKKAIIGALNLYLDFVNLFLSLLQLMGDRR